MSQQISYIALGASLTALVASGITLAITLRGPPQPSAPPPVPQCVAVEAPRLEPAPDAVFSATLCREDGSRVVLHYRSAGASEWQRADMAARLGKRFVKLELGDDYSDGIEYWVAAVEAQAGSAEQPMTASR